ncbi:hypothetical protein FQZ97_569690 [compost metagenome]
MVSRARVLIITEASASRLSLDSRSINSSRSSSRGTPACWRARIRLAQNDSRAASSWASDSQATPLPSLIRFCRHCASRVVLPKPALPVIRVRRQPRAVCNRASKGARNTAWLLMRGGEKRVVISGEVRDMANPVCSVSGRGGVGRSPNGEWVHRRVGRLVSPAMAHCASAA